MNNFVGLMLTAVLIAVTIANLLRLREMMRSELKWRVEINEHVEAQHG